MTKNKVKTVQVFAIELSVDSENFALFYYEGDEITQLTNWLTLEKTENYLDIEFAIKHNPFVVARFPRS